MQMGILMAMRVITAQRIRIRSAVKIPVHGLVGTAIMMGFATSEISAPIIQIRPAVKVPVPGLMGTVIMMGFATR